MEYFRFVQLEQVLEGDSLIGYIHEHQLFETNKFNERLELFDERILDSWGAGGSNFDEIRYRAYVPEVDGSLSVKKVCIADSNMMTRLRERTAQKARFIARD